jgi:hypothetical protein
MARSEQGLVFGWIGAKQFCGPKAFSLIVILREGEGQQ